MLPPNISGARQTSSGAGLKNFRPRGLLAGFFRRTQAHTPEPRPFRNSGGTDEATSAVQRIDNTGGAAGGFRVKCGRSASASSASAPAFHPRSSEFSADGCDNPWTVLNMGMD